MTERLSPVGAGGGGVIEARPDERGGAAMTAASADASLNIADDAGDGDTLHGRRDRLYRRIAWRIVPLAVAGYIIAYIDRVNVGFAKLQFMQDLSFSDAVYGLGAGLFFAGYFLFEVPSNLVLDKVGARKTLTRIMVLWGLLSAAMAFVSTPLHFYLMRFALGAAEAGFFPGIILYLSYWFPAARRGRITSLFTMGASIAGIIGNPLSGWLMSLDGLHGLRGWQILFIYEGLPAVMLGIVYFFFIVDQPSQAKWLSPAQRQLLLEDLAADAAGRRAQVERSTHRIKDVFTDAKVYVLALAYLSILAGTQAVALWAPTMLRQLGVGIAQIGWLGAVPFVVSALSMFLLGKSSDRHGERRWHFTVVIWAAGASLALLALAGHSVALTLTLLSVIAAGCWSALAVFWTIPPAVLSGPAKSGGIALISSAGALGGLLSPLIIGWSTALTGTLYGGFTTIGAMLGLSGLIILLFTRKNAAVAF